MIPIYSKKVMPLYSESVMPLSSDSSVITRRAFLRKTIQVSAGLSLAIMIPDCMGVDTTASPNALEKSFKANAFVNISTDNKVTVVIPKLEMGQGPYTGLATVVAEELDADWDQIAVESAPIDAERYGPQGTDRKSVV